MEFELDLATRELRVGKRSLILQEQPFQILAALLERSGRLVTREELRQRLWSADTFVDFERGLNKAVNRLREVLNDSAAQPRFIETLPRQGYRFIATAEVVEDPAQLPSKALEGKKVSHYRVLEILGGGGMGVVYKAEDLKLGRKVAIKFLPEELGKDTKALGRFEREARAASALDHPNICSVYEFGEHEGQPFIVMPLLEGKTLRDRIAAQASLPGVAQSGTGAMRGIFSSEELLRLAMQIADGLEAAHEKGIIHRDVKPANIFITSRGEAKILDFGLAKLTYEGELETGESEAALAARRDLTLTLSGIALGTAPYMSPEQVRGEKLDTRTDLFSFGLILYEMATGQQAFTGETAAVIREAIEHDSPARARQLNPRLSQKLEDLINKALRKDRTTRFQSAAEMRDALEQLERGSIRNLLARSSGRWVIAALALLTALALVLLGGYSYREYRRSSVEPPPKRALLAVLPLTNLTGDGQQEYLADGLTESLISRLAALNPSRIGVIARTSVMPYRRSGKDVTTIGRDLGVSYVVEGEVRRESELEVISVRLISTRDQAQMWSDNYQFVGDARAAIPMEREVSLKVFRALGIDVLPSSQMDLGPPSTTNSPAFEAYLRARYEFNQRTPQSLRRSLQYFQLAIDKDPKYAEAYAGLANTYDELGQYEVLPSKEAFTKGRAAAQSALQLDDKLGEAHAALGVGNLVFWDWPATERELRRAIELNPSDSEAHHFYSEYLSMFGRTDEALVEIRHAQELDPLSPVNAGVVGLTYYWKRQYDQSIEQLRRTLAMEPRFAYAHWWLALNYEEKRMFEEAIAECKEAEADSGGNLTFAAALGQAYALAGRRDEAHAIADKLEELRKHRYVKAVDIAVVYIALRDNDRSFTWLDKAFDQQEDSLPYLAVSPANDYLRSDPRFTALVRRIGLAK
jgi:serine/threonine-protein kinase